MRERVDQNSSMMMCHWWSYCCWFTEFTRVCTLVSSETGRQTGRVWTALIWGFWCFTFNWNLFVGSDHHTSHHLWFPLRSDATLMSLKWCCGPTMSYTVQHGLACCYGNRPFFQTKIPSGCTRVKNKSAGCEYSFSLSSSVSLCSVCAGRTPFPVVHCLFRLHSPTDPHRNLGLWPKTRLLLKLKLFPPLSDSTESWKRAVRETKSTLSWQTRKLIKSCSMALPLCFYVFVYKEEVN